MADRLDDFKISSETLKNLKNPEFLKKQMAEGKTFQEVVGFSQQIMDRFYDAAYQLFQQGRYEESADAFVFLTALNPQISTYWIGLGMSEQQKEEFQSALMAYAMATVMDVEDPLPYYHSAVCYDALDDRSNAIISLEMAIQTCGDHPEHASIKGHAHSALKNLSQ